MYVLPATLECRRLVVLLLLYSLVVVVVLLHAAAIIVHSRRTDGKCTEKATHEYIIFLLFRLPPPPPPYLHCSVGIIIMIIYPRQWQTYPYLELVMEGLEKELRYGAVGSVGVDSGDDVMMMTVYYFLPTTSSLPNRSLVVVFDASLSLFSSPTPPTPLFPLLFYI